MFTQIILYYITKPANRDAFPVQDFRQKYTKTASFLLHNEAGDEPIDAWIWNDLYKCFKLSSIHRHCIYLTSDVNIYIYRGCHQSFWPKIFLKMWFRFLKEKVKTPSSPLFKPEMVEMIVFFRLLVLDDSCEHSQGLDSVVWWVIIDLFINISATRVNEEHCVCVWAVERLPTTLASFQPWLRSMSSTSWLHTPSLFFPQPSGSDWPSALLCTGFQHEK